MELNIIWYVLIVVLFAGYITLDGFDLGVGMQLFKARRGDERSALISSIGPVWDGNEVWLITAGGALFAAFPNVYATSFSGFYTAFTLFLAVAIGRIISIEFRGKTAGPAWRKAWDAVFLVSNYLIVLLLGVSFGNIISGVPIIEINGVKEYGGSFLTLLHPYAIWMGLTAILTLRLHGLLYLCIKFEGDMRERLSATINRSWTIFLVFYSIATVWTWISYIDSVRNFLINPVWFVFFVLTVASIIYIRVFAKAGKFFGAFVASALMIVCSISLVGIGIFPNLLRASNIPANSLSIFTDSSSQSTLGTMLIIALIFVPIVITYQFIAYRIFRHKVRPGEDYY